MSNITCQWHAVILPFWLFFVERSPTWASYGCFESGCGCFFFFFFLISKIHPANLLCQLLLWCWSTITCDGGCVLVMLQACMQKLEVEEKKVGSWCHENRERILPAHSGSHLSFYLKIFAEPNVQVHLSSSIWTTLTVIIPEVKTASCLGQFSNANGKQYLSSSLVLGKVI